MEIAKPKAGSVLPLSSIETADPTPVASKPGRYTICLDYDKKIVRVGRLGVVTVSDVDEYIEALKKVLIEVRGKWGRVRVLADLRNAPIRLPDAAERMRFGNLHLYRRGIASRSSPNRAFSQCSFDVT